MKGSGRGEPCGSLGRATLRQYVLRLSVPEHPLRCLALLLPLCTEQTNQKEPPDSSPGLPQGSNPPRENASRTALARPLWVCVMGRIEPASPNPIQALPLEAGAVDRAPAGDRSIQTRSMRPRGRPRDLVQARARGARAGVLSFLFWEDRSSDLGGVSVRMSLEDEVQDWERIFQIDRPAQLPEAAVLLGLGGCSL